MRPDLLPVIDALRFNSPRNDKLRVLTLDQWDKLLAATDEARLTLACGARSSDLLPESVHSRVDRSLVRNRVRYQSIQDLQGNLVARLREQGIDFCLLKGTSHWPYFCDEPWHRPQYDIDFLFLPGEIGRASKMFADLGYRPHGPDRRARTDHLPPLIPSSGRSWRGDYFDPELPLSIELHFQLWDESMEGFAFPGWEKFWERREFNRGGGVGAPTLSMCDTVSYAAMHVLRHLLRADLKAGQLYELAHFLHRTSADGEFWNEWRRRAPAESRALQSVVFAMAVACFDCSTNIVLTRELECIAPGVRKWLQQCSMTCFNSGSAGKSEILLHLALARTSRARIGILARRLLPHSVPDAIRAHETGNVRLFLSRLWHHFFSIPMLLIAVLRFRAKTISRG
jgi:hypothetical protein